MAPAINKFFPGFVFVTSPTSLEGSSHLAAPKETITEPQGLGQLQACIKLAILGKIIECTVALQLLDLFHSSFWPSFRTEIMLVTLLMILGAILTGGVQPC